MSDERNLPAVSINFQISKLEELNELARILNQGQLVPKDYLGRPDAIMSGMIFCKELGLNPITGLGSVAVVNGRPTVWGDACKALCDELIEEFEEWFEVNGERLSPAKADEAIEAKKNVVAVCRIKRKGRPKSDESRSEFSINMAKRAGLWDKPGTWQQYPLRMLQMRARGFELRDHFADKLKGIYIAEEMIGETVDLSRTGADSYGFQSAVEQPDASAEQTQPTKTKLTSKMKKVQASDAPKPQDPPKPPEEAPAERPNEIDPGKTKQAAPTEEPAPKADKKAAKKEEQKEEKEEEKSAEAQQEVARDVTALVHERANIATCKIKKDPQGNEYAVLEISNKGRNLEAFYRHSEKEVMSYDDLKEHDGQDVMFLWKSEKKNGKMIIQVFDLIPADIYEAVMAERAAKQAAKEGLFD